MPAFFAVPTLMPVACCVLVLVAAFETDPMFFSVTPSMVALVVFKRSFPATPPASVAPNFVISSFSFPSLISAVAPLSAVMMLVSVAATFVDASFPTPVTVMPDTSAMADVFTSFQETAPADAIFTVEFAFFWASVFSSLWVSALPSLSLSIFVSSSDGADGSVTVVSSFLPSLLTETLESSTAFSLSSPPSSVLSARTLSASPPALSWLSVSFFLSGFESSPLVTPATVLFLMVPVLVEVTSKAVAANVPFSAAASEVKFFTFASVRTS